MVFSLYRVYPKQKKYKNNLNLQALKVHNALADAENWEIEHGPYQYFHDENTDKVIKARKGKYNSVTEAIKGGARSYPLKQPTHLDFSVGFVNKLSKDNPHTGAYNSQQAFYDALKHSGAEHFF